MAVGETVPPATFPQVGLAGSVAWSQGPTASVVFVPHVEDCAPCRHYLLHLGEAVGGLREWAARVMVAAPAVLSSDEALVAASVDSGVLVLSDEDGDGRALLGVRPDQAAVVQADRYGAVFEVEAVRTADADHTSLPSPQALVSLAQCLRYPDLASLATMPIQDAAALEVFRTPFSAARQTVNTRRISSHRTRGTHNLPSIGLVAWRLVADGVDLQEYLLKYVGDDSRADGEISATKPEQQEDDGNGEEPGEQTRQRQPEQRIKTKPE